MRVLLTAQPAFSHAAQIAPLAQALVAAGHTATIATPEPLAGQLREFGLDTRAVGPSWSVRPGDPVFDATVGAHQFFGFPELANGKVLDDAERIAREIGADLVVREYAEFSGYKIAKRLGIPLITHGIMHRLPPPMFERVAELAGAESVEDLLGVKFLDVVPRGMRFPWEHDMPLISQLQPAAFDGRSDDALTARLAPLGTNRPLIYFTLGTIFTQFEAVRRAVFAAVENMDVDVLYTCADASVSGVVPANVHVEPYARQSLILPRCAAVICHCGFGTMMGALRHGLPVLCLPLAADQPLNARSCADAGAGLNCANGPAVDARGPMVDAATLEAADVRRALLRLLQEPAFKENAQRIAGETAAMPGAAQVLQSLEMAAGANAVSRCSGVTK